MRNLALSLIAVALFATPALAAPAQVKVGDNFFKPTKVTIAKGARVHWTWKGTNAHNVALFKPGTSTRDEPAKRSKVMTKGGEFTYRFRKAGTWRVLCEIHPDSMRMKVVVKAG